MTIPFFTRRKTNTVKLPADPELALDFNTMFGADIKLTDSVALAVEFLFRALCDALPPEQQVQVNIDPDWKQMRMKKICCCLIGKKKHGDGRARTVYFEGDEYTNMHTFRVHMEQETGKPWRVVGFHYPHTVEGPGTNFYYAVFEPHHYCLAWHTRSGYFHPDTNPSY